MFWYILSTVVTFTCLHIGKVESGQVSCGYDSCPEGKEGLLNVHLVPHTHNDVGWLKTVDQYYYGHRNDIQRAGVQYILDSVVQALLLDEGRRFIYVESAFFWRWWGEQNDKKKAEVRTLVEEGRLEIIGGGWSMNDEAAAHYTAIIDNMSLGIKFFTDSLGQCARPRVSWQIDPFGHSREQANLFARMGFDGLFFGRLDYDDKNKRMADKSMEMVWRGAPDEKSDNGDLFTGALFHAYSPPPGFCFDSLCTDVIMDDTRLEDYNFEDKIKEFVNYTQGQASSFATDNLIMTMGEDFTYENANMWFKNMDKLKNFFNDNHDKYNINIMYSTPSCYLKALNNSTKPAVWPTKEDDFFPYASDPHAFWTGYFTSRPALKGMIREANSLLQACKQVHSRSLKNVNETNSLIHLAKRAVAVNQHHDAVTGTAKQHVTDDYALRLDNGMTACRQVMSEGLQQDLQTGCSFPHFCPMLNISQCSYTEQSQPLFSVLVYNPLAEIVSSFVRLPVMTNHQYRVLDSEGKRLETQTVQIPAEVINIPGRESKAKYEVIFKAENLPGLGSKTFNFEHVSSTNRETSEHINLMKVKKAALQNSFVNAEFGPRGTLEKISYNGGGVINIKHDFAWYEGAVGDNSQFLKRASGAYIFRPNGSEPTSLGVPQKAYMVKGPLVSEVHQAWYIGTNSSWASQVIRLYHGSQELEFEWLVGPLPDSGPGHEVIARYTTDIDSGDLFQTDSNGRGMIERRRNHRDTWSLNLTEPVSANYYPVTSRISLEDSNAISNKTQLWVLTDRAEGGTSLQSGELELMLHRRLFHDDAFGVGEPLNETAFGSGLVVRGKHLLVGCFSECEKKSRESAEQKLMKPVIFFGDYCSNLPMSPASVSLPAGVKLLTLERWDGPGKNMAGDGPRDKRAEDVLMLVRLENILTSDCLPLDLSTLFPGREIVKVEETTLDGNLALQDLHRLKWKTSSENTEDETTKSGLWGTLVTIPGKQIRSFKITVISV